nr:hypothetical protein [Tanacetum cinerariifolium]
MSLSIFMSFDISSSSATIEGILSVVSRMILRMVGWLLLSNKCKWISSTCYPFSSDFIDFILVLFQDVIKHVARECQKPKRAKDAAYHREKMLLCKQEEAGIQLNVEQADWRDDTDDESEDQELEADYMYMAQI